MIAEHEADLISLRTKQALQALRDKGVKLGAPPFKLARAQHMGGMATKDKAEAYRSRVSPILTGLLKDNHFIKYNKRSKKTIPNLQVISDHLNGIGLRTMYNKPFNSESLRALMKKEKFI
jgi:DNA invertase Pin-like site-specific DNA recombinase